ncbi:hypothetical protein SAMN05216490_1181 [Mucilaginibacter mallensis]|uniref:Uncharacterized protein n=1 Tax=Mucilaginibacter mallensis TaxID=652787 RepID=A0A1H1SBV0_MUCMA|nr:hypothetical protein SAMN05216490_1181 [Mucilaginibacter mallensis]
MVVIDLLRWAKDDIKVKKVTGSAIPSPGRGREGFLHAIIQRINPSLPPHHQPHPSPGRE